MSHPPADQPSYPPNPSQPGRKAKQGDKPRREQLPQYRIILHPDAVNDLMYVVRAIMEVTRFCRAEATNKMWQAHHSGRAVLLVTYCERAELYVEQLADKGLTVTLEPA
jgi:ATP-dependent Clp protease adaptor protein ClpS